jgi:hypothetical protein
VTGLRSFDPACRRAYAVGQVPSLADPGLAPPTPWWQRLWLLEDFMALRRRLPRTGGGSRAQPLTAEERALGQWCNKQRQRRRGRKHYSALSPAQEAALEGVPGWQWEPWAEEWEQWLQEVAAFEQQHGRLPRCSGGTLAAPLTREERELGDWCTKQRQRRKGHGASRALTPEQAAKLEALPGWQWVPRAAEWERHLQEVAAFGQRHGRLPREEGGKGKPLVEGERELGVWCSAQRQRRKGHGRSATLTPEQAAKLEALPGWQWDPRAEEWEQRLQEVAAFGQQHGRLPRCSGGTLAAPLTREEHELGTWCHSQRQRRKGHGTSAELAPEQAAKLEALPGWQWDQRAEEWEQRLQEVVAFGQRHGRLPRQQGRKEQPLLEGERELGVWCSTQRQRRKGKGTYAVLTPERAAKLESIPGWRS